MVPPHGFRLVAGLTELTTKGTLMRVAPGATGIRPISSVTMGYKPLPATGVTVQVSCVVETTTIFVQSTLPNLIELILVGKSTPLIVRVVPECVKKLI